MTRLKYTKLADGNLTNKHNILAGLHNVEVRVFTNELRYELIDEQTHELLAHGTGASLNTVKIHLKAELKKLGAIFDDEVRSKNKDTELSDDSVAHTN